MWPVADMMLQQRLLREVEMENTNIVSAYYKTLSATHVDMNTPVNPTAKSSLASSLLY